MESIKTLRMVNMTAVSLVALFNMLDFVHQQIGAVQYIFLYVAPFVLVAAALIFLKDYRINAILYAVSGIILAIVGSRGNFSGVIFLIFSIYIFNKPKSTVAILILTSTAIASRCLFLGYSIPDTLNIFVAYAFTFAIYFVLIHPKKSVVSLIDDDTLEVIRYIKVGKKPKEIAGIMNLTIHQVRYRLRKAKDSYDCKTDMELCTELQTRGIIDKNTQHVS